MMDPLSIFSGPELEDAPHSEDVLAWCQLHGYNSTVVSELQDCPDGILELIEAYENFQRLRLSNDNSSENFVSKIIAPLKDTRDFVRNCQSRVFLRDRATHLPDRIKMEYLASNSLKRRCVMEEWSRKDGLSISDVEEILSSSNYVEIFIRLNQLDETASKQLRNAPEHIQKAVIEDSEGLILEAGPRTNSGSGNSMNTYIPGSDIRRYSSGGGNNSNNGGNNCNNNGGSTSNNGGNGSTSNNNGDNNHGGGSTTTGSNNGSSINRNGNHYGSGYKGNDDVISKINELNQKGTSGTGFGTGTGTGFGGGFISAARQEEFQRRVDKFFIEHSIDESARRIFYAAPLEVQMGVIDEGPLIDARNNNAVLVKRVNMVTARLTGNSAYSKGKGKGRDDIRSSPYGNHVNNYNNHYNNHHSHNYNQGVYSSNWGNNNSNYGNNSSYGNNNNNCYGNNRGSGNFWIPGGSQRVTDTDINNVAQFLQQLATCGANIISKNDMLNLLTTVISNGNPNVLTQWNNPHAGNSGNNVHGNGTTTMNGGGGTMMNNMNNINNMNGHVIGHNMNSNNTTSGGGHNNNNNNGGGHSNNSGGGHPNNINSSTTSWNNNPYTQPNPFDFTMEGGSKSSTKSTPDINIQDDFMNGNNNVYNNIINGNCNGNSNTTLNNSPSCSIDIDISEIVSMDYFQGGEPPAYSDLELRSQVEEFCSVNGLSDEVRRALMSRPDGTVESIVMMQQLRLNHHKTRDTSEGILWILKELGSSLPHIASCRVFLRENDVSPDIAQQFMGISRELQEEIIKEGDLDSKSSDPSSYLNQRIQQGKLLNNKRRAPAMI